jgi:uncharacterized protein GlcG (DUF336 family)
MATSPLASFYMITNTRDVANFAAIDFPSVAGTTPSATPSSVIVGTVMAGCAAVSGGTYQQDGQCAKAAVDAIK